MFLLWENAFNAFTKLKRLKKMLHYKLPHKLLIQQPSEIKDKLWVTRRYNFWTGSTIATNDLGDMGSGHGILLIITD